MAIRWTNSASKHGITRDETLYAMQNPVHVEPEFDESREGTGERADLFIGPRRLGGELLEVMAHRRAPRDLVVFHAMPLRRKFMWMIQEEE
ncbi:hypothetical protein [Luteimicrobium subarcticum]|uniref:Uncharacterized protein n=1 Tax=Luteimicrobium subarcticum TaxID=620910 RepID=A0A2M8WJG8_9MICO|nr:hypothetical protein [Luteimicrobium subarcticum]PJI91038.1 hypothetical protein CLV34_2297 [Luteimicrobium subarcticum]